MGTQRINKGHREWLDNEYSQWVKALQESTVDNFGSHPMVKRMLGEVSGPDFAILCDGKYDDISIWPGLKTVMSLGGEFTGNVWRMIYYAQKVLERNPTVICEIGGGVGQFYAVLLSMGYTGKYYIYDLKEAQEFQGDYLFEFWKRSGIKPGDMSKDYEFDYCVSFYAFGEFDDTTKQHFINTVISKVPHGMMVFNPHSGASSEIPFPCKVEDEYPLTSPGNKFLSW